SISSALAPGRLAFTETTGASVFGIRSRPSDSYDTAPSTMSAAVIMMAKTGRLTLTSASFIAVLPLRGVRRARHAHRCRRRSARGRRGAPAPPRPPGRGRREFRGRQRPGPLQAGHDLPEPLLPRAEGDLLLPRLAALEDVHGRDARERRDGILGRRHHVLVHV